MERQTYSWINNEFYFDEFYFDEGAIQQQNDGFDDEVRRGIAFTRHMTGLRYEDPAEARLREEVGQYHRHPEFHGNFERENHSFLSDVAGTAVSTLGGAVAGPVGALVGGLLGEVVYKELYKVARKVFGKVTRKVTRKVARVVHSRIFD